MNVTPESFSVDKLVGAFRSASLVVNEEYQRGVKWSQRQQATFIDSIMRGYPVPAIFLHKVVDEGLGGTSIRHEIVDGQQRLTALRNYIDGKWPLYEVGEGSKLRIPKSVLRQPASWAGRSFDQLTELERQRLLDTEISVFVVDSDTHPDEVRDLFIRLQSGTALSRQQIRDAWPGNLGPYIETMAGKLDRHPRSKLFATIDKRGQRNDDESRDRYVIDRQVCAQLLTIFLARQADPFAFPAISANALDALYHEQTDFDPKGEAAKRFEAVLDRVTELFQAVRRRHNKRKTRRQDVTSAMMYFQDMARNPLVKLGQPELSQLAQTFVKVEGEERPSGKSTSAKVLRESYEWWRTYVSNGVGIRLDPRRAFDQRQKAEIRSRTGGDCALCGEAVIENDAEYDHHPIPYRDGGRTEAENGRLVHASCHPRGRPRANENESEDD